MKNVRIYQPGPYEIGQTIELAASASQHVAVVLRMQVGEVLTLFCGDNREFSAQISSIHKKKVAVFINDVKNVNRESLRNIHLAQAISKGERMEFVIQKSVELGVTSITPLVTDFCVVRIDEERMQKKLIQWQAIAIAACEQCGRNQIPLIHPVSTFNTFLKQCKTAIKLLLHPIAQKSWHDYANIQGDITLIIGPEGGLSEEEVKFALENQFQPLRLGPRILRTETAALAALSVLQAVCGDLGDCI